MRTTQSNRARLIKMYPEMEFDIERRNQTKRIIPLHEDGLSYDLCFPSMWDDIFDIYTRYIIERNTEMGLDDLKSLGECFQIKVWSENGQ